MTTFADLGLSPAILKALEKTTLKTPTPIQAQAIPHIMQGRDLMGLAQTGTGKTAAFGLPLLHRLLDIGHPPGPKNVRALILAPTRELIAQIKDNFEVFTKGTAVKVTMVVGGASLFKQAQALSKGTDVLVATPGRLIDLLERGDVSPGEMRLSGAGRSRPHAGHGLHPFAAEDRQAHPAEAPDAAVLGHHAEGHLGNRRHLSARSDQGAGRPARQAGRTDQPGRPLHPERRQGPRCWKSI